MAINLEYQKYAKTTYSNFEKIKLFKSFKVGDKLKITCKGEKGAEILEGQIIDKTPTIVIIKLENYRICFSKNQVMSSGIKFEVKDK